MIYNVSFFDVYVHYVYIRIVDNVYIYIYLNDLYIYIFVYSCIPCWLFMLGQDRCRSQRSWQCLGVLVRYSGGTAAGAQADAELHSYVLSDGVLKKGSVAIQPKKGHHKGNRQF